MPKLLCTGDLHLGAGTEYGRQPGDRLHAQEQVWRQILELAVDEAVDGILFAGDAFEGPTPTSEHYDAFLRPIRQVLQERIPILAISGNGKHDSAMRATNALAVFNGYGIDVHTRPDVVPFAGCAVACLPWVSPARMIATRGGGDRDELNADVGQLLVDVARELREACAGFATGTPSILLAHWSITGAQLPNGLPLDQLREPLLAAQDLHDLDFDTVVAGHIHLGDLLIANGDPYGFYVGSPMPLNFGEGHYPHGAWIIDWTGESGNFAWHFHEIDSPRFVTIDVDLEDAHDIGRGVDAEILATEIPDGAIVRVRYRATAEQQRQILVSEIRALIFERGAAVVKVLPEIVREQRARVADVDRPDEIGEREWMTRWLDLNHVEPELRDETLAVFDRIRDAA